MDTSIYDFYRKFYTAIIQNLDFHLQHVRILDIHKCGKERHEATKHQGQFQDEFYQRDYAEHVVDNFANLIQYEYYSGIRYMYIKGIASEQ